MQQQKPTPSECLKVQLNLCVTHWHKVASVEAELALHNEVGPQLQRDVPVSQAELAIYIYSIR